MAEKDQCQPCEAFSGGGKSTGSGEREAGGVAERVHRMRGEVCRKIAKTGLIHVSLAHFVGRLVCYRGFTGAKEVFSGKNLISACGLEE